MRLRNISKYAGNRKQVRRLSQLFRMGISNFFKGLKMKKLDAYKCKLCGRLEYYEAGSVLMPFMMDCPACGSKNALERDTKEKVRVFKL